MEKNSFDGVSLFFTRKIQFFKVMNHVSNFLFGINSLYFFIWKEKSFLKFNFNGISYEFFDIPSLIKK